MICNVLLDEKQSENLHLSIVFKYKHPNHDGERLFTFKRSITESLDCCCKRMKINLEKAFDINKKKKKTKKKSCSTTWTWKNKMFTRAGHYPYIQTSKQPTNNKKKKKCFNKHKQDSVQNPKTNIPENKKH